jgi:hypothetical protein
MRDVKNLQVKNTNYAKAGKCGKLRYQTRAFVALWLNFNKNCNSGYIFCFVKFGFIYSAKFCKIDAE